jgi:ATP-dependent DNA helicase RecG
MELSLRDLLQQLFELDEQERIEAKTCSEIGKSVMETVCAFANEPGLDGGYLILGVAPTPELPERYKIVGIEKPDKLLNDLQSNCRTRFNNTLRIRSRTELIDDKNVILVYVPEAQPADKPTFFKNKPLPGSAWRRGPNGDYRCNEDDLAQLYQARTLTSFDETVCEQGEITDIEPDAVAEYRKERATINPNAEELRWEDTELLLALNCLKQHKGTLKPTVAGIMLFGTKQALRRLFPMVRVDYIRVSGKEWVEDPEHRFTSIDMRDSIFRLLNRATAAILDDLPKSFSLPEGSLKRQEQPLIPLRVIREALVNALMHRSYQVNQPVQIIRYSNRLEIRNPGYSLKAPEQLGEPGSRPRNPHIAAVLHETPFAETKGSGIRTMRNLMEAAGLTPPLFESARSSDLFTATYLLHHFLSEGDIAWLSGFKHLRLDDDEARALVFARETGKISNSDYRGINKLDTLTASQHLGRLRDLGVLLQKGKGPATFYVLSDQSSFRDKAPDLFTQLSPEGNSGDVSHVSQGLSGNLDGLSGNLDGLSGNLDGLSGNLDGLSAGSASGQETARIQLLERLTPSRRLLVNNLGQRRSPEAMKTVILELCREQEWRAEELGILVGRGIKYVRGNYVRPLLKDGLLELTIPDEPNHPHQAYRAAKREDS